MPSPAWPMTAGIAGFLAYFPSTAIHTRVSPGLLTSLLCIRPPVACAAAPGAKPMENKRDGQPWVPRGVSSPRENTGRRRFARFDIEMRIFAGTYSCRRAEPACTGAGFSALAATWPSLATAPAVTPAPRPGLCRRPALQRPVRHRYSTNITPDREIRHRSWYAGP